MRVGAARLPDRARRHGHRQRRPGRPGRPGAWPSTPAPRIPTKRRRTRTATTTSSSCAPARTRSRSRCPASRRSRRRASRSATNQVVRTNAVLKVGALAESVNVEAKAQVLNTDSAVVSETIGQRAVVELAGERPQRLEPGEHDARRPGRAQQRHRPELPRRRPARDSEQPVARRHQLLVQPAGRDEHAADRRRGDGDPGADRQHLGRVRLLSRRPHQRRHQERHQRPRTARVFEFLQDDALDERGYFENPRQSEEPATPQSVRVPGWTARSSFPRLYDGHNKTFFMGAYEGVAGRGDLEPVRRRSRPRSCGRETSPKSPRRSETRSPGSRSRATSFRQSMLSPVVAEPPAVLPGGEPCRAPPTTTRRPSANTDNVDQFAGPRRSEHRQQGPAVRPLQLARQLQQQRLQRRHPDHRRSRSPASTRTRCSRTRTRCSPNLLNDFRIGYHRIDFDTLNHFSVNGVGVAGARPRHPRVRRRRRVTTIPGIPSINVSNFSEPRRRRHELVPVRHDVPGVERAGLHARVAQRPRRLRPAAAGDRPPRRERPARPASLHRRHHRLLGGGLHARAAADGDPADGPDPGPRRRLAQRVLRQRRLAGGAKPHAEPRPALRDEHARPDLRGAGLDAGRRLRDDHPGHASVARASSSRSRTTRTSRRASAPPTASARRPSCARASGSTTTRTR